MPAREHAVTLETDRPRMPDFCVCCGASATDFYRPEPVGRMKGLPQPDEPLSFPYCDACKLHLRAAQDRKTSNLVAVNLAIWGIGIPLAAHLPLVSIAVGPAIGALLYVRGTKSHTLSANCTADGAAAQATWLRKHTYAFTFTRRETAEAFLELNRDSLTDR